MTRQIDYRCRSCGSNEISFDATSEWDVESQEFVVLDTQDYRHCNSQVCQGEECNVAPFDAQTGEALGRAPRSFEYIPKAEADAAWAQYHEQSRLEQERRARARQQDEIIAANVHVLTAAYQEITA